MKQKNPEEKRKYLKTFGVICASILFYALVMHLDVVLKVLDIVFSVLYPFILGLAIAFIVNIPLRFFEKKVFRKFAKKKLWRKIKRPVCLFLSWLLILSAVTLIFALILPQLISAIIKFFGDFPGMMDHLDQTVSGWIERYNLPINKDTIKIDWSTISRKAIELMTKDTSSVPEVTFDILKGFTQGLLNLLVGFFFSIYVLASKESLGKLCKSILYSHFKKENAQKILSFFTLSGKAFSGFVAGQCTEAVLIGVLCFIGMKIFRFPHAILASCIIAVTALVPIFGAIIGALISAFLILLVSPFKALLFLIYILILQQIESNVVYPKIMGKHVGLPGIWVLLAVTVGGNLGGVAGMIISVPICSIFFTMYEKWLNKRLIERNIHHKVLLIDHDEHDDDYTPGQTHIDFDHPDQPPVGGEDAVSEEEMAQPLDEIFKNADNEETAE